MPNPTTFEAGETVLVTDAGGTIVYVGPAAATLGGASGDLIGTHVSGAVSESEGEVLLRSDPPVPLRVESLQSSLGAEGKKYVTRPLQNAEDAQYRLLFESGPFPMWIFDRQTLAFLAVNEAAIARYGYSREEFLALTVEQIRPEETLDRFNRYVRSTLEQVHNSGIWQHRTKSGKVLDVEIRAYDLTFAGREARLVLALDITEERLRDASRRYKEARVRNENQALLSLARNPLLLGGDLETALRAITEAGAGTLQAERSSIWMYSEDRSTLYCADLFERSLERHSAGSVLEARAHPGYFAALETERTITSSSQGSMFSAAYLDSIGITSLLDAPIRHEGRMVGVICHEHTGEARVWETDEESFVAALADMVSTAMENVERKKGELALRRSEERYRLLFERNLAGVYRITLDGQILDCNMACAHIFGFDDIHEFVRRRALDFYPDPSQRAPLIERLLAERAIHHLETRLRRRDGQPIWVIESVSLLEGPGGEPIVEGTIIDITDLKEAEDALRESEARYRLMAENSTDLISRHAPDGTYLYASPASMPLLGYIPEELLGQKPSTLCHPDDLQAIEECMAAIVGGKESCSVTFRMRKSDDSYAWLETTSRAVRDEESAIREIISVSRDVTERRLTEEQVEYQAYHDPLTNLPNRVLFRDRIGVALAHARRLREPVAVLFLDLDDFKLVNDTFGHSVGDHLLQRLAGRLRAALREEDTVARMGGDEFTILLSDLNGEQQAAKVARKLLETIALPLHVDQHELFVTASIGIAMFPTDGEDAETLLKNADSAMYRAKELGRNLYQLCTPAMNRRATERLSMESSLRRAMEHEEFTIYYQPQVRADTGEIMALEALVRWQHPERGVVLPSEFISIAEETRLIIPLGEWVLRTAAGDVRRWQESWKPGLRLAVNLSPRQFQQKDLTRSIERILFAARFDPAALELEITESAAMHQIDWTVATLHRLKEMGITISIDDFGTGHSSLSYLKRFPIDSMKIDHTFVHDVHRGGNDTAIVKAIISIAQGLRLRVIAEGVEHEDQVTSLRELGCNEMQGYFFCRPIPRPELTLLFERARELNRRGSSESE
jgi:diguanylate cyclase (GGDEF)-like protein/PAS domain S-box-containing protein